MAQVSFKEGLKANLPKSNISQGALYLTTDAGELYFGKNTSTLLKITDTDKATNTQLNDAVDILNTKLDTKLPLSGGDMSGHIYLTGAKASSSTGNTSQLIFGTSDNEHVAISSNNNALVINPTSSATTNQIVLYLDKQSSIPSGISTGNGKVTSSVSSATATYAGLIKVSSVNSTAVTVNSESATAGRYYPIELNSNGKAIVNVPWTDTTYTLSSFGITASATELNYVDGVTSAIQTQLNGKAPTNHASTATTYGVSSASNYGHAMASSTTPKANGTATVGTETAKFARGDHVHPLQTAVSGSAGSATKDSAGQTITSTYIKSLSVSGTTITYTRGDNTTGTITTQDNDTNTKVTQANTTADTTYNVLLSYGAASTSSITNTVKKSANLKYNPSTDLLTVGNISGKAGSATKLATARTINGVAFDGTTNIETPSATVGTITLTAAGWALDSTLGIYKQTAAITGLTAKHKVDLDADYNTISVLKASLIPYNDNGTFYVVTDTPPEADIAVQYTMILTV